MLGSFGRRAALAVGVIGTCGVAGAYFTLEHTTLLKSAKDQPWESYVKAHGPLKELYENRLWQVSGVQWGLEDARNMTVYRANNNTDVIIHTPVALNESEMQVLESIGEPTVIVVPNESSTSTMDVVAYQNRYPSAKVAAPAQIIQSLQKHGYRVDVALEDLFSVAEQKKTGVSLLKPPMVKMQEIVLDVELDYNERGLLFGELISNLKLDYGIRGRLLWTAGFVSDGKQPQVPGAHRSFAFSSRQDMLQWFKSLSEHLRAKDQYRVLTMQHGTPLYHNISRKIEKIALGYQAGQAASK